MAEISVFSPVMGFNGVSVGVAFTNGHALVEEDSPAYQYFKRRGYQIGNQEEDSADPDGIISAAFAAADGEPGEVHSPEGLVKTGDVDIPGMPKSDATRGEIAEFAEGMGLETEGLSKAKIIEKIRAEAAK